MMLAGALEPTYTDSNACEFSYAHLPKPARKPLLRAFVFLRTRALDIPPRTRNVHYVVYLDEFGHVGPFLSRDHAQYKTSPVFGFGGFLLPVDAVREFAIYFYRLKCHLLSFELERQDQPAYRWEKKGAQFYTVKNVLTYKALRVSTGRLLNQIRKVGGYVIYAGECKSADAGAHRAADLFKRQLLRLIRIADQFCRARNATFLLMLDEQQAGNDWRERNMEACTQAMFEDASEKCRALIEPPIQGESYLFQTLQCADWICGLVGRLCAYQTAPDQYGDWAIFHRYFDGRIRDATFPACGLSHPGGTTWRG